MQYIEKSYWICENFLKLRLLGQTIILNEKLAEGVLPESFIRAGEVISLQICFFFRKGIVEIFLFL